MKKIPLLPRYFRWIGLGLVLMFLIPTALYMLKENSILITNYPRIKGVEIMPLELSFSTFAVLGGNDGPFEIINTEMSLTLQLLSIFLGLSFIAFTKYKYEDEMINSIRLYSWSWSIISFAIFNVLLIAFVYGSWYISLAFLSPNIILLLYIIIFRFQVFKMNRRLAHEE